MADALDQAADAFSRDMGRSPSPSPADIRERARAPEPIFGNSERAENDLEAGGDNLPLKGERRPPRRSREEDNLDEPVEGDEDNLDEPVEGDEDNLDEPVEGDEDDEEDKGGEEDEDELLSRQFEVMVDGEPETVPLREALQGYIRTKTFHKRMNQLDGARKELGTHAEKIVVDRQKADQYLQEAEEILNSFIPTEPDWDKLFAEDPAQARNLQKQHQALKDKVTEIRTKRLQAQKEAAEKAAKDAAEYGQAEFPKFAAHAKWRSREDMQKDITSMRKTAMAVGFSEEEISQVLDSRMLIVLHKASKYDRMMASRPKPVKTTKTPVGPGAGSKSTARRGMNGAQKQLARTGSVEDAASVFARIIK